ncbi:MAG TPA: hypothetical protein VEO53_05140 [Candidatus Binatia bacterium]|nr:hypothetical protein [Candidatus Binatia bacterium]
MGRHTLFLDHRDPSTADFGAATARHYLRAFVIRLFKGSRQQIGAVAFKIRPKARPTNHLVVALTFKIDSRNIPGIQLLI